MKTFFELREKTLTKAELKKREEVAKAIERENPNMPMDKKMAIATATAKKVVEATLRLDVNRASNDELKQYVKKSSTTIARSPSVHPDVMHTHDAAQKELKKRQKMQEEAEQIDEISRDLARRYIRKVADKTNTGELSTKQVLKRRPGVTLAGKKAYPGVAGEPRVRATESVTLDELSKKTLGSYVNRSADDISHIQRDITSTGTQSPDYKNLSRMRRNRKAGIATAVKKLTREEAELDEAVEVSHDRYMRSHGKKASGGEGNWMFTHKRMGDANVNNSKEVHSARGKFSDAKKSAQQWAKKHGHSTVYVMEEVALDEVSDKKLDAYRQKAFADQPAGDDGSDKYRKRKFGRDLAFAKQTGRAKVRATKEEVENLDELSKKTLGSYVKKAAGSAVGLGAITTAQAMSSKGKADPDDKRQLRNRMTGVSRATDRLTKEETNLDEVSSTTIMNYSIKAAQQGMKRVAGQKTADEKMRKKDGYSSTAKVAAGPARARKESVELDEGISNLSHSRLKFHATKGVPHGSYSNKEIKDEHNRRMRVEPDYVKAKASMNEEVELDEVSQTMKDRYIQKSMSSHGHNAAVASDAKSRGDQATYDKARKIMKKRNQGMTRAFGGERA